MIKSRNSLKAKASNFSKISKIPNMYIIQVLCLKKKKKGYLNLPIKTILL